MFDGLAYVAHPSGAHGIKMEGLFSVRTGTKVAISSSFSLSSDGASGAVQFTHQGAGPNWLEAEHSDERIVFTYAAFDVPVLTDVIPSGGILDLSYLMSIEVDGFGFGGVEMGGHMGDPFDRNGVLLRATPPGFVALRLVGLGPAGQAIAEPGAVLLMSTGLGMLLLCGRRRMR